MKTENLAIKTDYSFELSSFPDLLDATRSEVVLGLIRELKLELLSCRFQRMDQPIVAKWPRVLHDTLLYAPVRGSLRCRVGDKHGELHPGDLLIVPDSVPHSLELLDENGMSEAFAVHVHVGDSPTRPQLVLAEIAFSTLAEPSLWHARLRLLCHLLDSAPETAYVYARQLVRHLLIDHVLRGAPVREDSRVVDPRVTLAMARIAEKDGASATVESLARHVGLSISRFRVLFKQATGTCPKRYLLQRRLGQVRRLLIQQPDLAIDTIAGELSFANAPQLYKAFRQAYGVTPGEFRRRELDLEAAETGRVSMQN